MNKERKSRITGTHRVGEKHTNQNFEAYIRGWQVLYMHLDKGRLVYLNVGVRRIKKKLLQSLQEMIQHEKELTDLFFKKET